MRARSVIIRRSSLATLRLTSNDPLTPAFDILLTGSGTVRTELEKFANEIMLVEDNTTRRMKATLPS